MVSPHPSIRLYRDAVNIMIEVMGSDVPIPLDYTADDNTILGQLLFKLMHASSDLNSRYRVLVKKYECLKAEKESNDELSMSKQLTNNFRKIEEKKIKVQSKTAAIQPGIIAEKKCSSSSPSLQHHKKVDQYVDYSCDACNKTYMTISALEKHKKFIHAVDIEYKCSACNKTFKSKSAQRRHHAAIHDGVRFYCNICNQPFTTKSNMIRHLTRKICLPQSKQQ